MHIEHSSLKETIRAMGRKVDWRTIGRTYLTYTSIHSDESRQGIGVQKDVAYGTHTRHRLDIYFTEKTAFDLRPILVYVHGGGFVQGDKSREANVGYYFAKRGILSISINYRLAPRYQWPAGAEDLASVVHWLTDNAEAYGGDSSRIVLMGHSAGAAHVATFLFDKTFRDQHGGDIHGAVLLSGPAYDTEQLNPQKDYVYYGKNVYRHSSMSIIGQIGEMPPEQIPHLFIGFAELDPPELEYQAMTLFKAVGIRTAETDTQLTLNRLRDHNHISEIMHINTDDDALGGDILAFLKAAEFLAN